MITDNTCTNNNMDGIDCDYTTKEALVKFNTSNSNTRHGIFIEQGATYNTVYGNTFNNNSSKALALFNNAEPASLPVAYNTSFCNSMTGNPAAMSNGSGDTGSDGTTPVSSHNFFLNNGAFSDTDSVDSSASATQNYYSQTILSGDTTPIVTAGTESFFNPPPPPAVVADPAFTPPGGSYPSAQSVTLATVTAGASIRYTTDGSTP